MDVSERTEVRTLPARDHPAAAPCTVYPPKGHPRPALSRRGRGGEEEVPADQGYGLVIHLYGASGSHTTYNLMRPPYDRVRRGLRERGYWIVVPDLGPAHWMSDAACRTMDAVIEKMIAVESVRRDRVCLLGTSMGAGSALIYGHRRPGVFQRICAIFPMTDLVRWTQEKPGYLPKFAAAHNLTSQNSQQLLRQLSPISHPQAYKYVPMLLIHGAADPTVPVHHSRDFCAALKAQGSPVIYHEVPDGVHKDDIAEAFQEQIVEFLTA